MSVKYVVFLIVVGSLVASVIQAVGAESVGLEFYGQVESYAEYEPWNWRLNATQQFFFQTKSKKPAMIFYQDDNRASQFMDLFLINGKARFRAKVQGMNEIEKRVIRHDFADSKWHKVNIELSEEEIKLSIDTEDTIYNARPIVLTQYAESLDNAALYVGGIPLINQGWSYAAIFFNVYEKVPAVFEGCISDIRFNRAPNGGLERARLRRSKKATNTCKGDCEKRPERCANDGRCIDMIRDSECDCRETEYEGRSCAKRSTVVFMNGNGAFMSYNLDSDNPLRSTERNALEFRFLTEAKDGVFFYMGRDKDHLLVELVNGSLRVQADFGDGPVVVHSKENILSDSCWHHVEIRRRKRRLTAMIDLGKSGTYNANFSMFTTLNLNNQSNLIYFGGGPSMDLRFAKAKRLSFKGYLQKLRFEGFNVLENALQNKDGFSHTGVMDMCCLVRLRKNARPGGQDAHPVRMTQTIVIHQHSLLPPVHRQPRHLQQPPHHVLRQKYLRPSHLRKPRNNRNRHRGLKVCQLG